MTEPWVAEFAIEQSLACALIEAQFPNFAPARLEPLGTGWDNTAFLVNGTIVFRFPRRQIAVPLLDTERRLLPRIAPSLPLAIPTPEFYGQPTPGFPWPFLGYRFLPGRTASAAALYDSQRTRAAEPVARFLRILHSVPAHEVAPLGVGPDTLGRLEVPRRAARARHAWKDSSKWTW